MAKCVAGHHAPDLNFRGPRCHGAEQCPGFKIVAVTRTHAGEEMIIDPECIESKSFRLLPNIFEFRDRGILLGNLEAKADSLACVCPNNLERQEKSGQDA